MYAKTVNTHNRVVESSRLNIARLDASVKPITKLPQPKQASVEHVHQVNPKPKGDVKGSSSIDLMSQEIDMSQIRLRWKKSDFKAQNAPIFEVKDLQQVSDTVACVASVETTEH